MTSKNFLILFSVFLASCTSANLNRSKSEELAEKQQLRKDFAFCKCLDYAFGDTIESEIKEVDFTKGMLFDIADLGGVYDQLDSVALDASSKITVSRISDYGDRKPIIFDCLEFHRSKELDVFVKSLKN